MLGVWESISHNHNFFSISLFSSILYLLLSSEGGMVKGEGGMVPYWTIHWGSGIIRRLRTPDLNDNKPNQKFAF